MVITIQNLVLDLQDSEKGVEFPQWGIQLEKLFLFANNKQPFEMVLLNSPSFRRPMPSLVQKLHNSFPRETLAYLLV